MGAVAAELLVRARLGRSSADLAVTLDAGHTVAELGEALAGWFGRPGAVPLVSTRLGRVLDPDETVGRADLLSGDELVLGAAPGRAGDRPIDGPIDEPVDGPEGASLVVDVVAGPDSGRSHPLRPGRHLVGRARGVAVRLDDAAVSRRHLTIEVSPGGEVRVEPYQTPNGVLVDGVEIDEPTAISPSEAVTVGGTRLAVRPVARPTDPLVRRLGVIDVHRTPYRPPLVADRPTDPVGPVPDRVPTRRLPVVTVLAPLLAGLAMYAFTRQLQFLALTLLSPVLAIGTAVEDRRAGRRDARAAAARFRQDLVGHRRRFDELREAERSARHRAAPDLADLVRRAELRSIDLWARGRDAPDFLVVRLGLGTARTRFPVVLAPGGADDLRSEAEAALDGLDRLDEVPVTVPLDGVVALQGTPEVVGGVAASLLVQAATLHSPEDLTIAAATAPARALGWVRWLPHARSVTSHLPGDHVATTRAAAAALIDRVLDVAEGRAGSREPVWPRLLVVLEAGLVPDPVRVARLLDLAPAVGMSVLWLAGSAGEVPRQASRTVEVRGTGTSRGRLWSTDPSVDDVELELDRLSSDLADRAARALAPLRDASTVSLASTIPRRAPLLDVLGVGQPSAEWVVERWLALRTVGLRFPLGLGADGPVEVDLVEDGPHALVGGTSGSGKSELLQSMVASLAAHHPPNRLTFLFVDYKGGAASHAFAGLPHTVGHVTNLSAELASRALVSLRAELHRRMALLDGRAKDLAGLLAVAPDDAPPSLVIVVDEFATLVREVPEFVTGIVDIAQRGRSLGIHLVLATQRPTGAVDENILANTNLRISLRMLDRAESTAVVGVPDAAAIPVPLRGRGIVRLGPHRLVEFQGGFAGAPLVADPGSRSGVRVRPIGAADPSAASSPGEGRASTDVAGPTQLDAILDAIAAADRRLAIPPPRCPWRDPLPAVLPLDELDAVTDAVTDAVPDRAALLVDPGRFVTIGRLDVPEHQEQPAAVVDLVDGGGLLVFGSGGTGATTLLRTFAASLAASASPRDVAIVVLDLAGRGCAALSALPPVVEVVHGDDLEAVTRQLVVLERELDRRRRIHGDDRPALPRVVVLIDGFGALRDALVDASPAGEAWVERVIRLVVEGRQVGIHAVVTADRRGAVPARIHAAISHRIVLRQADDAGWAEHGLTPGAVRGLGPGRGVWSGPDRPGPVLVQIASVSTDPSPAAQAAALDRLTARLATAVPPDGSTAASALRSVALAARVPPVRRTARPGLAVMVGPADVTGVPATVDLGWSHLAVYGPPRSGRSTALATIASQLADGVGAGGFGLVLAGPATSPLRDALPACRGAFGPDLGPVLAGLGVDDGTPTVLIVDDLDLIDDPELLPLFDSLVRRPSLRLVAAMEPRTGFTTNPLVTLARRSRRLLVLQPDDAAEFVQLTGVRLALRPGLALPPGRGVLLVDRSPTVVQVFDVSATGDRVTGHPVVSHRMPRAATCRGPATTPPRYSRSDVP